MKSQSDSVIDMGDHVGFYRRFNLQPSWPRITPRFTRINLRGVTVSRINLWFHRIYVCHRFTAITEVETQNEFAFRGVGLKGMCLVETVSSSKLRKGTKRADLIETVVYRTDVPRLYLHRFSLVPTDRYHRLYLFDGGTNV